MVEMATSLEMHPNNWFSQILRTYPKLHIIDDMTWRHSIDYVPKANVCTE
jgi:hypothetical protein